MKLPRWRTFSNIKKNKLFPFRDQPILSLLVFDSMPILRFIQQFERTTAVVFPHAVPHFAQENPSVSFS